MSRFYPVIYRSYEHLYLDLFEEVYNNGTYVEERNGEVGCNKIAPICYALDLNMAGDPFFFMPGRKWGLRVALAEINWILSGTFFLKNSDILVNAPTLKQFKDPDDGFFWAQYGSRIFQTGFQESVVDEERFIGALNTKPPINQIQELVDSLQEKDGFILPSRRLVVSIWSPFLDLVPGKKDYACNVMFILNIRNDRVNKSNYFDISVIRRSNDIIWGIQNNFVQFWSILVDFIHKVHKKFPHTHTLGPGFLYEYNHNLHMYKKHNYGEGYDNAVNSVCDHMNDKGKNVVYPCNEYFVDQWPAFLDQIRILCNVLAEKKDKQIKYMNETADKWYSETNLFEYMRRKLKL